MIYSLHYHWNKKSKIVSETTVLRFQRKLLHSLDFQTEYFMSHEVSSRTFSSFSRRSRSALISLTCVLLWFRLQSATFIHTQFWCSCCLFPVISLDSWWKTFTGRRSTNRWRGKDSHKSLAKYRGMVFAKNRESTEPARILQVQTSATAQFSW